MELGIAIAAVLVSLISFAINLRASSAAERHGRMPVLILQSVLDQSGSRAKVGIRNIGPPYTLLTSQFGTKIVDGVVMVHPPLSQLSYPEQ